MGLPAARVVGARGPGGLVVRKGGVGEGGKGKGGELAKRRASIPPSPSEFPHNLRLRPNASYPSSPSEPLDENSQPTHVNAQRGKAPHGRSKEAMVKHGSAPLPARIKERSGEARAAVNTPKVLHRSSMIKERVLATKAATTAHAASHQATWHSGCRPPPSAQLPLPPTADGAPPAVEDDSAENDDERRRLRWIAHYVKHARLQEAFDLGWDGVVPSQRARAAANGAAGHDHDVKAAADWCGSLSLGIRLGGEREPPQHPAHHFVFPSSPSDLVFHV